MSHFAAGAMDSSDRSSAGNDDEFSEESFSDEEEHEPGMTNAPMMSIFASYYGIVDPQQCEVEAKGTIDDSNFDSEEYVKNVLRHESVDGLVVKDAELVHEIRNLDGEMQKLVYDNYNKFITATETIKEMKSDVYSMDSDMNSVRENMKVIAETSTQLDGIFEVKRQQVDKLVRVRRLLDRLDFLSELPDKLAVMINNQRYKEAVQLYNKSISVLTRHSHVLSFKNIKERTELMMADMTSKVIDLLDDSSLEAVKLTQYVVVLRLMKAPKAKVMAKLLAAHKTRSVHMVLQFNKSQQAIFSLEDSNVQLSLTRQFHQSMVVSLIEACKGIRELYSNSSEDAAVGAGVDDHEAKEAYQALVALVAGVMSEYQSSLLKSFKSFFEFYHAHHRDGGSSSADTEFMEEVHEIEKMVKANGLGAIAPVPFELEDANGSSINTFALQEERNSWLLLARQAILDVVYLDSAQRESVEGVQPHHAHSHSHSHSTRKSPSVNNHAERFADSMLTNLYTHCRRARKQIAAGFVKSVARWLPKLQGVAEACRSPAPLIGGETYHNNVQRALATAKKAFDVVLGDAAEAFSEAARNAKPVVDILEVTGRDCRAVQGELCVHFAEEICSSMCEDAGLRLGPTALLVRHHEEDDCEIFAEPLCLLAELDESFSSASSSVRGSKQLLMVGVVRKLAPRLVVIMEEELQRQEFPASDGLLVEEKARIHESLDGSGRLLGNHCVEANRVLLAERIEVYQSRAYASRYESVQRYMSAAENGCELSDVAVTIDDEIMSVGRHLDHFALLCVLMLLEAPPQPRPAGVERDLMRRANMRHSVVATSHNQSMTLQHDIDRLFSQKVRICETIETAATMDSLVSSLLKTALKTMLECLRVMTVPLEGYLQVQADVAFLKQTAVFLLKDTQGCDALVDQVLSAVFSRYCAANDLSNAVDNAEMHVISKTVNEALQRLGETTALVSRASSRTML